MAEQSIPTHWRNCATCSRWCGKQIPDDFYTFVKFDPNEKAKCVRGLYHGLQMPPLGGCSKWEQRFKRD